MQWNTTALLFPGQNSQVVGMGADFAHAYPASKTLFNQADRLLGLNFAHLMFNGPADDLNETINTQPAVYIHSMVVLRMLRSLLPDMQPAAYAGHSLGEFTALTAADALDFTDGLRLVRERGRLMGAAGDDAPGAMAAILGMNVDMAQAVSQQATDETGKSVILANDNCPGQVVLSGDIDAIDRAMALASEKGARKVIKLAVSVAAHSPLMQPASDAFNAMLAQTDFSAPQTPVYGNVNAAPLTTVEAIRTELDQQLTQTVRWTETIQAMLEAGIDTFIEVGPGDVLTGLVKRIDRKSKRITLNSVDAVRAFVADA